MKQIEAEFNKLNMPNLLDDLRKATKGAVSDIELMKKAVDSNNLKVPLDKLPTLLEFATVRAKETIDNYMQHLHE